MPPSGAGAGAAAGAGGITTLTSPTHLKTLLQRTPLLILDFHAPWCTPCHAIAPTYTQLAKTHSSTRKLGFASVDVDAVPDVAREWGVTAMPTFLLLRWEFSNASTNMNGKVIEVERVRGADVAALRALVGRAVGLAAAMGQGQSQSMGGGGNVLGSSGTSTTSSGGGGGTNRVKRSGGEGWYALVARFVMLYLVTLFSLDPVASVEGRGWVSKVKTG